MNVLLFGSRMDLISGHSRPAYELAARLKGFGHSVRIVSSQLTREREARHQLVREGESHLVYPETERLVRSNLQFLHPPSAAKARIRALSDWADVIHGFSFWATPLFGRHVAADVPIVQTLNTLPMAEWSDFVSAEGRLSTSIFRREALVSLFLSRLVQGYGRRRIARYVAWTDYLRDHMISTGLPAERVVKIQVGLDPSRFPEHPRPFPGSPVVLYFGLERATRGPEVALRVFRAIQEELPGSFLAVALRGHQEAGDEAQLAKSRRELHRKVKQLGFGDRVAILGFEPRILPVVAAADVVLLPFQSPFGYSHPPLTILESLALGKPVVSTKVGSIPEMIDRPLAGRILEPWDQAGLARAVIEVWEEDSRERQTRRKRLMRSRHDWEAACQAIIGVYEWALTQTRGASNSFGS